MRQRYILLLILPTIIATCIFFLRLFAPVDQLFVTQDFGRSDVWHFSYPTKYFLSEQLKAGTIPLWNEHLGQGFPIYAEGQTGTFFIPNLISFSLLKPSFAYNAILVLTFITLGVGIAILFYILNFSALLSGIAGATYAFAGLSIAQIPHITLLQGFSLMPWILVLYIRLLQKQTIYRILLLAFITSQQIFAGFPQATFITALLVLWYTFFYVKKHGITIKIILAIVVAGVFSLGLSAAQLLPSYEFLQESTLPSGFSGQYASFFSFPFAHFKSLLWPFILGSPQYGSYPPFYDFNGSIFWENTIYIGVLPLTLIPLLLPRFIKKLNTSVFQFFLWGSVGSAMLMLGSHSPLYFIFAIWPFNLFRAPSRFIWLFLFFLIGLCISSASQILENMQNRTAKTVFYGAFASNVLVMLLVWWSYHPISSSHQWLTKPAILQIIQEGEVTYSPDAPSVHNSYYLTNGWTDLLPYKLLQSFMAPASNIIWNVSTANVYAGRFLRRQSYIDLMLSEEITSTDSELVISPLGSKLLDIYNIQWILTSATGSAELQDHRHEVDEEIPIIAYRNIDATSSAYISTYPVIANTLEDAREQIQKESFHPYTHVLVEEPLSISPSQDDQSTVSVIENTHTKDVYNIRTNVDAILVTTNTYYPGWEARVEGNTLPVIPVNIRQLGVVIPKGEYDIHLSFNSSSFRLGKYISISFITVSFAMVFGTLFATRRRRKITH